MADTYTFDAFWTEWLKPPRRKHESRAQAEKAWNKAVKRGNSPQKIHGGVPRYKATFETESEAKFIRLASVWLNNDGFNEDYEALAQNALGYHTVQTPKKEVMVGGRVFGYLQLAKIKGAIISGRYIEPDEWEAFKKWQELGNWTEVRLPPKPEPLPSPEERRAYIEDLQKRGLL